VEEDSLKEALKERGLGTSATRAAIIETLLRRTYIVRRGKALYITDLGVYLIALIQDPILKSAEMTGDWEAKLKEIERGKPRADDFMEQVKSFTRQLIQNSEEQGRPFDSMRPCPRCGAGIVEGKRGYGCEKWKEGCSYVLWKEYRGHQIGRDQATELFRRHISLSSVDSIEGADGCVLYLSEAGHVFHVALPHGNTSAKKGRKASAPGKNEARAPASAGSEGAGFECPTCQSAVIERPQVLQLRGVEERMRVRDLEIDRRQEDQPRDGSKACHSWRNWSPQGIQEQGGKAI
jgi:DNA topoisomerase-3